MNREKILILGAAGFVGSNLYNELSKTYYTVGVDDLSFGNVNNIAKHLPLIRKDVNQLSKDFINEFDIIISSYCSNLIYAINNKIETFKNNTNKSIQLFNDFKNKIIYTSTSSVYGQADMIPTSENVTINTKNAYDTSKRAIEMYLQKRGNFTTLRLSNVYGENQRPENPFSGVICKLIYNILTEQEVIVYGNGFDTRDYTYISDVVNAVNRCLMLDSQNTEYNIGTGEEYCVFDLIKLIEFITGKSAIIKNVNKREIDTISRRCLNINKAKLELRWQPFYNINDGLIKTVEWIKNEYNL